MAHRSPITTAEKALAKQYAVRDKLHANATAADEEYARQQALAGQLPDNLDPDNADALSQAIVEGSDALARAKEESEYAWQAVWRHIDRLNSARRAVIAAHAEVEAEAVKAAEAALAGHTPKVEKVLAELQELEGVEFVPKPLRSATTGSEFSRTTTSARLSAELRTARIRLATLHYWLQTGRLAGWVSRKGVQVTHDVGMGNMSFVQIPKDARPDCLYGPEADLPEPPPQPTTDASKVRINAPVW